MSWKRSGTTQVGTERPRQCRSGAKISASSVKGLSNRARLTSLIGRLLGDDPPKGRLSRRASPTFPNQPVCGNRVASLLRRHSPPSAQASSPAARKGFHSLALQLLPRKVSPANQNQHPEVRTIRVLYPFKGKATLLLIFSSFLLHWPPPHRATLHCPIPQPASVVCSVCSERFIIK